MSTKKRFSISPDLASGLRSTIKSASSNQGQLHYDMMAIDVLETDPLNPRRLSLNRDEILNGIPNDDADYEKKFSEREALLELAESIKRIGIKNAIEVYKDGSLYRIITGERRYWAAIICGHKSVPVRVSQKPDEFNLRYTQWVENIHRQDLSLWEKFNNLLMISSAYQKSQQGEFTEQALQSLLGVSHIQAYRYYCLLKADEKIIELIKQGKLKNLKLVQELAAMKDQGAKNQIIAWIGAAKSEVTSLTHYREAAGKKPKVATSKNPGISLGKIKQETAKELMEIVMSHERFHALPNPFKKVDWQSSKSVSKAFKQLFEMFETSIIQEEIA